MSLEFPGHNNRKSNNQWTLFLFQDALTNYKALDDLDIIPNAEAFECLICMMDIEPGDGVVLRECLHTFCKVCQPVLLSLLFKIVGNN